MRHLSCFTLLVTASISTSSSFLAPKPHTACQRVASCQVKGQQATLLSKYPRVAASAPVKQARPRSALNNALGNFVDLLKNLPPDTDLAIGAFVIFAAVTPYTIGLFFPKFLFKEFFLPVYGDLDPEGRRAEIYWKLMYATQGLVLTTMTFAAHVNGIDSTQALRNSYIAWALFYVAALIKIRVEADKGIIQQNRFGIQLWHLLVAVALCLDVVIRPGSGAS